MEKQYLPIDNKSIMQDWIFDKVFKNGFVATPRDSVIFNSIIGVVHDVCVLAEWGRGDTMLRFDCSGFAAIYEYTEAKQQAFIEELCHNLNDENSTVEAEITKYNKIIYVRFYVQE